MNPLLISALISAVVGFGSAWTWQGYRMDNAVNTLKLEAQNEQLSRERAGRQALADAQAKVAAAQADAQAAADRAKRDAAGAGRASVGVRDALANAVRSASTDLQTCTGQVNVISELLTSSTDLSRRLATEADEWANQAVTLQNAWPK
jgi:hypothetical protein